MALILDNGSYSLKVGYSGDQCPRLIPNAVFKSKSERRRIFVGSEIEDCKDLSGLFYVVPFQKGYLVNWDIQRQIWDLAFGSNMCNVDYTSTDLMLTEPLFNFPSVRESHLEVFLEEYNFKSLTITPAPVLSSYNYTSTHKATPCCLVVDVGYSFTHITPFHQNRMIMEGIKRIDVGGKILTNYLKEIVSYRQLQVLDEAYVMNQVKEDVCYVSMDFNEDMKKAKIRGPSNPIAVEYILPDYSTFRRGFVKQRSEQGTKGKDNADEQCLHLANERISVPEILFHPSDIGISQMGIPEAICHSIAATPTEMHPQLFSNIVLIGGTSRFKNFKKRVFEEVRRLAPEEYPVEVFLPDSPELYSWFGGQVADQTKLCNDWMLKVSDYRELGGPACLERLDSIHTSTFLEQPCMS